MYSIPLTQSCQEMTTKSTITSERRRISAEQQIKLAPPSDGLNPLESGLDSLCFAILVARFEDSLGVDPFTDSGDITFPITPGDLVQAYENTSR